MPWSFSSSGNPGGFNMQSSGNPGGMLGLDFIAEGAILYLDAGNSASYPGTGTTWFNLAGGGNNGTLTNGPTFSSDNKGIFTFNGTNNYVAFTDSGLIPTAGLTISTWFKTTVADKWLVDKAGGSFVNGYSLAGASNGSMGFGINNRSVSTAAAFATTGNWLNVVATWIPSTSMIIYNAGSPLVSITTTIPASINNPVSNLQVARRANNTDFWNGSVAQVVIYNRALSAGEVLQNFTVTRGRFGV